MANAKSVLNEFFQRHHMLRAPTVEMYPATTSDGYGVAFVCDLTIHEGSVLGRRIPEYRIEGVGRNKKDAHLDAATRALDYLAQCGIMKTQRRELQPNGGQRNGGAAHVAADLLAELSLGQNGAAGGNAAAPAVPPMAGSTLTNTLDHEITMDDVDDMSEQELRTNLKRALREIQTLQAHSAGLLARVRRAAAALTDGGSLGS